MSTPNWTELWDAEPETAPPTPLDESVTVEHMDADRGLAAAVRYIIKHRIAITLRHAYDAGLVSVQPIPKELEADWVIYASLKAALVADGRITLPPLPQMPAPVVEKVNVSVEDMQALVGLAGAPLATKAEGEE